MYNLLYEKKNVDVIFKGHNRFKLSVDMIAGTGKYFETYVSKVCFLHLHCAFIAKIKKITCLCSFKTK